MKGKVNFTPGPWKVSINTSSFAVKAAAPYSIVKCVNQDREANAHLIAAAPKMYEMLEIMAYHAPNAQMQKQIEDLLAKARGL